MKEIKKWNPQGIVFARKGICKEWLCKEQSHGMSPAMWDHTVTYYPTQVNAPRPNPSPQAGTRFTYHGGMEG